MRSFGKAICVIAIAFAGDSASGQIPCRYDITLIPDVHCGFINGPFPVRAMSNTGIVVGHGTGCSGNGEDSWWWNEGQNPHLLPRPQGVNSVVVRDVSDNGIIVGYA